MNFEKFKIKLLDFKSYSSEDLEIIEKAFYFGEKAYQGIKRLSGEPYFYHCLRTALNLASLNLDAKTISAGILHDVLEDGNIEKEILRKEFGEEIYSLVEGVSKISFLKYKEKNLVQAENLRKLILAIIKDIRVAFIKLADRLDNMQTLQYLPLEKQKRIALETADIYVPLANRLGISKWASELDDLALKYLDPEIYNFLEKEIQKRIAGKESYLESLKEDLEKEIRNKNINLIKIEHRIKRISSVYKKLQRKNFDLDQIYDLLALRIIVKTIEECYLVLGILHSLFKPLPHEFNDYIAFPKPNGYQSLHTTVITNEGDFIEFQIRTEEMHLNSEYGLAAYFAYSDFKQTKGYKKEKAVFAEEEEIRLLKQLRSSEDNLFEFISEKIYVLTPKGDVIELLQGSTPLDFAYKIHSYLGDHFAFARVNQKIVPIDYQLKNGDLVEIITAKNRRPSLDWLNIVKSNNAKKKIKAALKRENSVFRPIQSEEIKIIAKDRIGLLKDITNIIAAKKINILSAKSKTKKDLAFICLEIQSSERQIIQSLKEILKNKIKDIIKIE
jgi:GTP pyrophosphokinase